MRLLNGRLRAFHQHRNIRSEPFSDGQLFRFITMLGDRRDFSRQDPSQGNETALGSGRVRVAIIMINVKCRLSRSGLASVTKAS